MERRAGARSFNSPGSGPRAGLSLFTITVLGLLTALSTCGGNPNRPTTTTTTTTPIKTITSIVVNGTAPHVGSTDQMTATASFSDGTSQDITTQAAWTSSNAAVASVNAAGVVTGVGAGQVNITAGYQNSSGTISLTLSAGGPPPQCTYSLSVGSTINGDPSGGAFPVTVSTGSGCPWTATSAAAWLHVSIASSTGTGNVTINEDVNTTGAARVGSVSVAGQTITFNQPPSGYSLSGLVQDQGTGLPLANATVTVTMGNPLNAKGTTDIKGAFEISGIQPGATTLQATMDGYIPINRTEVVGSSDISGIVFNISPCTYSLSDPSEFLGNPSGGTFPEVVNTSPTCHWTATTDVSWLHVSPGSSTGPGNVTITEDANKTGTTRVGHVMIAGVTIAFVQTP